jgi:hypothetical protein
MLGAAFQSYQESPITVDPRRDREPPDLLLASATTYSHATLVGRLMRPTDLGAR